MVGLHGNNLTTYPIYTTSGRFSHSPWIPYRIVLIDRKWSFTLAANTKVWS